MSATGSLHDRALLVLKQINRIMDQQLRDVDLLALKRPENDSADAAGSQDQWLRILESLAAPVHNFSVALRTAAVGARTQVKWTGFMYVMVVTIAAMTAFGAFLACKSVLASDLPLERKCIVVGSAVTVAVLLIGVYQVWMFFLAGRAQQVVQQLNSPVMRSMVELDRMLAKQYLMRFAWYRLSGSVDPADLLGGEDDDAFAPPPDPNSDDMCASAQVDDPNADAILEDVCMPPTARKRLDEVLWTITPKERGDILDRLQIIRTDVRRFDRIALWRCVSRAVERLRRLVKISPADGDDKSSPGAAAAVLTHGAAERAVVEQVLPLFMIRGREVAGLAPSARLGARTDGSTTSESAESKAVCYRKCSADGKCAWAAYDSATKQCRRADTLGGAFERSAADQPMFVSRGAAGSAFVCGAHPSAQLAGDGLAPLPPADVAPVDTLEDAVAKCTSSKACSLIELSSSSNKWSAWGGDGQSSDASAAVAASLPAGGDDAAGFVCAKMSSAQMLDASAAQSAAQSVSSDAWMLRDMSALIVDDLVSVLGRYGFAINMDDYRDRIQYEVRSYYGDDAYDRGMADVLDEVLDKVRQRVREAVAPKSQEYLPMAGVVDRMKAFSSKDWVTLSDDMRTAYRCVKTHRVMFPPVFVRTNLRVLELSTVMLSMSMLCALAVLCTVLWTRAGSKGEPSMTPGMAVRITISSVCAYGICVMVLSYMTAKYKARVGHNEGAIKSNGDMLVGSMFEVTNSIMQVGFRSHKPSISDVSAAVSAAAEDRAATDATVQSFVDAISDPQRLAAEFAKSTSGDAGLWEAKNESEQLALATRLYESAKNAVEAYDKCNYITNAQPKMPFPVVELSVYAVILLLLLAVAAVAIVRLGPGKKVGNLSRLLALRRQLRRGERPKHALREIQCCSPPDQIWDSLINLSVAALVVANVWFIFSSYTSAGSYASALDAEEDCV